MKMDLQKVKIPKTPITSWGYEEYDDAVDEETAYDAMLSRLEDLMNKKNKDFYWKVSVVNFGWRKLSGENYFKVRTPLELLREVLPKTECCYKIYNFRKGMLITNSHHDSPCGFEKYYVRP